MIVHKTAAREPASSFPRNNQFFRPIAWSLTRRSEMLLSIVSRPSSVYRHNARHWFSA